MEPNKQQVALQHPVALLVFATLNLRLLSQKCSAVAQRANAIHQPQVTILLSAVLVRLCLCFAGTRQEGCQGMGERAEETAKEGAKPPEGE